VRMERGPLHVRTTAHMLVHAEVQNDVQAILQPFLQQLRN